MGILKIERPNLKIKVIKVRGVKNQTDRNCCKLLIINIFFLLNLCNVAKQNRQEKGNERRGEDSRCLCFYNKEKLYYGI